MVGNRVKLSDADLEAALRTLPKWRIANGKLNRSFEFADFDEAWGFMNAAARVIQEMDHHPEWFNVYNRVRVDLTTHDAGGITIRDLELAKQLDRIAASREAR